MFQNPNQDATEISVGEASASAASPVGDRPNATLTAATWRKSTRGLDRILRGQLASAQSEPKGHAFGLGLLGPKRGLACIIWEREEKERILKHFVTSMLIIKIDDNHNHNSKSQ